MSLTRVNLAEVIKKQYLFKLKANIDAFSSLIGIQLIGILFSFAGVGSMGGSSEYLSINVKYYSSDLVIGFTMVWAFMSAITITTKPYRHHDFTFVTNRVSSNLSNALFLATASIIGGLTAMLSGKLITVLSHLFFSLEIIGGRISVGDFLIGIVVATSYIFLAGSIGYFIGALVQVHKIFILLIVSFVFGLMFLETFIQKDSFINGAFQFYFGEPVLIVFLLKVLLTSALLFLASIRIFNRMEVRR
ncbi:hypothetical protein [Pseudoneobacillus sp. C159]